MVEIQLDGLKYHESRTNLYRSDTIDNDASERTPLIASRFPPNNVQHRDTKTKIIVGLMTLMLITGVIIGIYLLVEQYYADNILPPIDAPLQLVTRSQWDPGNQIQYAGVPVKAQHVIVVHTDTQPCWNKKECEKLLLDMQNMTSSGSLPYNFLISSDGLTFEALGWKRCSSLFPPLSNHSLVLALIGEFSVTRPTSAQLNALHRLIDESVSQRHLLASYTIITRNTRSSPVTLIQILQQWQRWDPTYSDSLII